MSVLFQHNNQRCKINSVTIDITNIQLTDQQHNFFNNVGKDSVRTAQKTLSTSVTHNHSVSAFHSTQCEHHVEFCNVKSGIT